MWVCGQQPADTPETQEAFQEWLTLEFFEADDEIAARWRDHGDRALNAWIAEHPGTRPEKWWRHCAPEPRRRLGGSGVLWSQKNGGFSTDRYDRGAPALYDVDENDLPRFESEFEYLERLGLLMEGERDPSIRPAVVLTQSA
jgi:hypothetical protein